MPSPFPNPLPVPPADLVQAMNGQGFQFQEFDQWSINHDALYESGCYEKIQQFVKSQGWDVSVSRQFWNVWHDSDYKAAPLWNVNFPDLWIDEVDFASTCDECGRKRIKVDTNIRVSEVKSKKPLHSVNGQFKIVSAEVKSAIAT